MIKNYFKIAWRNIWSNKLSSAINIVSLEIGLSASFVIGMMIYHDFSFDTFHPNKERIYRLTTEFESDKEKFGFSGVNVPLKQRIKEGMPGIEKSSSLFTFTPFKVEVNDVRYKEPGGVVFTDKEYFEIFQYQWLAGTKEMLEEANRVILTQGKAKEYFPNKSTDEILGETLTYDDSTMVVISGIVADFEENTDLVFEEFISLPTAIQSRLKSTVTNESWNSSNSNSQFFVLLNKNTKLPELQKRLDALAKAKQDKESVKDGHFTRYALQPLAELHFSEFGIFDYGNVSSNKSVLFSLLAIALFLLTLGCINFINLNTAQATKRAKEIGIRKTLGSSKKQLISQFLVETFLLTLISGFLSIFFGYALFNIFREFLPSSFKFELIQDPLVILGIALLLILLSLLAGTYPALFLSRFKPVTVLKGRMTSKAGNASLRKFLTFFQFAISQVFIIAAILVGNQIHYMLSKDLGFKSEEIAYFRFPYEDGNLDKRYRLKNELSNNPNIGQVSIGGAPPASNTIFGSKLTYAGDTGEVGVYFNQIFGDINYLELYDIPLLAGRKPLNDSIREYVINETLLEQIGFRTPEEALHKTVRINEKSYPIVGVMKDFNPRSLKSEMEPIAFVPDPHRGAFSQFYTLHFSINPNNDLGQTMEDISKKWKQFYPDSDLNIQFMDETIAAFYKQEQRISKLLKWATGLSILISVLGLLGLVIYTTQRKVKEIGIRKVLGASLLRLNYTLCREFIQPIVIAIIIAIPIAWYGMNQWLENFAYRTDPSWWIFAGSAVLTVLIALLVMSIKTIQAASKNPVKSLRTE